MTDPGMILLGQTLSFCGDPFVVPPETTLRHEPRGAVLVRDGRIAAVGPAERVLRAPDAIGCPVVDHGNKLIMAGFVDCHIHYPQIDVIASYGTQLLEWLDRYTFPAEQRFADPGYAAVAADFFLDECLRNGITTACVYCTVHKGSVTAFFERAAARGLRMVAGKVCMDRNAPAGLTDTATSAYDDSKALIDTWHGHGRLGYAITPRFALTSTPEQMDALGALWRERPDVLMQTHIAENRDEIAAILEAFPHHADYLTIYEHFGLIGPGTVLAHCIHLTERERRALHDTGAAVAHCPTSNLFIGSGLCDVHGLHGPPGPVTMGLATDVGGGSSFSPFATMRAAYEVAQLRGATLHPVQAFYLATLGSAKALRLNDRIGNLMPGYDADIVVLGLTSTPLIARRMTTITEIWEGLFVQMILADDRAVDTVYAAGRVVHGSRRA